MAVINKRSIFTGRIQSDSNQNPPLPYEDKELIDYMNHSFWFLPRVNSCEAMKNLLESKKNVFFTIIDIVSWKKDRYWLKGPSTSSKCNWHWL